MTTEKKLIIDKVISGKTKEEFEEKRQAVIDEAGVKMVKENAFRVLAKGDLVEVENEENSTGALIQVELKGNPVDIVQCYESIVTSIGQSIMEEFQIPGRIGVSLRAEVSQRLIESLVNIASKGFSDSVDKVVSVEKEVECDCASCQLRRKLEKAAEESGGAVSINAPIKDVQ